ncbi:hypothetical protein OU798_21930 [Prolixibacteraceae bacterium Z1-6]|uniref:Uncharacterized protein n=1 Tax=Draconibacterium aestuarii TaxID=2998507 RepID=A0A9X3FHZ1_9BACT|nr:hypothetical protein [Prolixibacteraceae bacterium Z1-6]
MKRSILLLYSFILVNGCLFAQKNDAVIVKAGTRLIDYFPVTERYIYPDFTQGKAIFTKDRIFPSEFNFNMISCEMEFIKSNDTLIITDKSDLLSIVVAQDTFYYHHGYLQKIQNGKLNIYLKRSIVMKDILKKGAMGTINRSAASESYDYLLTKPLSWDLVADIDIKFQKEEEYFYSVSENDFVLFNKKNSLKMLPNNKHAVRTYIESNKIDFKDREDVLELTDFICKLMPISSM